MLSISMLNEVNKNKIPHELARFCNNVERDQMSSRRPKKKDAH